MKRAAGILMHITSLNSPFGIGTLGDAAYKFADFLRASGQTYWQILPIGPTSYGDSPYQSFSTYAGNPYLIDFDLLRNDGLLNDSDYNQIDWGSKQTAVSYNKIYNSRFIVLRKAYEVFKNQMNHEFNDFLYKNKDWLEDYALYMAVKSHFGMISWVQWPDEDIRLRKPSGIKRYSESLSDDIQFWKFVQFKFFEQWTKLKKYVNSMGIKIIGDIPIYVAMDSADTWSNPDEFWLDENNIPIRVAGCPPDAFSSSGQLWGNPLYDWTHMKSNGYRWWINRIKGICKFFDITRIDHFRGFDSYYAIPYSAKDAKNGEWLSGPGMDFFEKMKKELGNVEIIAEDLGFLTPGVIKLVKDTGYPGMKILEFAFDAREESDFLPHNYDKNSVVYTGTHDNETVMGWVKSVAKEDLEFAKKYALLTEGEGYNWGLIRTAYSSVSNIAIIPMQDFLGLGNDARMNTPSTLGENWIWRIKSDALTKELANRIKGLTKLYGRVGAELDEIK